jgi:F-type H+-transporting ATPase subunit gamma
MRLVEIEAHMGSMVELREIVSAMRSLASMRAEEAQRMLPGIRSYAETMAAGISAALLLVPEPRPIGSAARGPRALVVCTAEHGFVGGFNERVLDAAKRSLGADDPLFILGSRGAAAARERGWPTAWVHPMATRSESAPETIRRLTADLYRGIAAGDFTRVEVTFARHRQRGTTIEQRPLFPVDSASLAVARPRQPPLHNLPPDALLERLIADYVFALLTEAAVESLASENAARFAAMQSAYDNVSKQLEQLRQDARQARQAEITTELLDVVAGAEAQESREMPPSPMPPRP